MEISSIHLTYKHNKDIDQFFHQQEKPLFIPIGLEHYDDNKFNCINTPDDKYVITLESVVDEDKITIVEDYINIHEWSDVEYFMHHNDSGRMFACYPSVDKFNSGVIKNKSELFIQSTDLC